MTPILLMLAAFAQTAAAPAADWPETLRADARAMHDDIAANHPGPVNALDPDFSKRNDAALATALKRADEVRGFPGYFYAMKAYAASFEDGHLNVGVTKDAPALPARWPGFLTGFDGDRQVVLMREDAAPVPLGAVLEGCDGRPADELARRMSARSRGGGSSPRAGCSKAGGCLSIGAIPSSRGRRDAPLRWTGRSAPWRSTGNRSAKPR